MSESKLSIKKVVPIIVAAWILSLITTLAVVYYAPNIFPPLGTERIADNAIISTKLADGSIISAKILDGTVTAADMATGSITTISIADGAVTTTKIADGAVTNQKLASYAIPFVSTYSTSTDSTDSTTSWVDMDGMSVTISLERRSNLLILFSTEAYINVDQNYIVVRALVDTTFAVPGVVYLTPTIWPNSGPYSHSHKVGASGYSFNFYQPSVDAGSYTVKTQWMVSGGLGYTYKCTLTVIALPS